MNVFNATEPEDQLRVTFIAACIGAGLATLWGLFGLHEGSVTRTEAVLQGRVEAALRDAGLPGLEVQMHGQRAMMFGIVSSRAQITAAHDAALSAAGAGGAWAGGVTIADVYGVHVGASDSPFALRIWRDGSSLVLDGAAPSESARRALLADATALFPNAVALDKMHVAGGAPSANWVAMTRDVMQRLSTLSSGEARLSDADIVIEGGGSQNAVNALRRHYQNPPAPFHVSIQASVQ
ncbi:MAG: hypothetical protein ABUS57_02690 [Pseudomonadota bacterium]